MRLTRGRETKVGLQLDAGDVGKLYGDGDGWDSAGTLGYDGQDMHHKIYMLRDSGTPICKLEGSVNGVMWFEIDEKTVGATSETVAVFVTGTIIELPYKFIRLTNTGTGVVNVQVDSFGTLVR